VGSGRKCKKTSEMKIFDEEKNDDFFVPGNKDIEALMSIGNHHF